MGRSVIGQTSITTTPQGVVYASALPGLSCTVAGVLGRQTESARHGTRTEGLFPHDM